MLEVPGDAAELSPSAKLVYKSLDYVDEPLTQHALAEETLLPERTVRYALTRLEDAGVVDHRWDIEDARRREYYITDA